MSFVEFVTIASLLLLLAHAVRTHGGWFAAIWLGLPAAMWCVGMLAFAIDLVEFTIADGTHAVQLSIGVYLAALFGKGFIERTRLAGGVLPFAITAGFCAIPISLAGSVLVEEPQRLVCSLLPIITLVFSTAYRVVSLFTKNNAIKFGVLAAFAVPIGLLCVFLVRFALLGLMQVLMWLEPR